MTFFAKLRCVGIFFFPFTSPNGTGTLREHWFSTFRAGSRVQGRGRSWTVACVPAFNFCVFETRVLTCLSPRHCPGNCCGQTILDCYCACPRRQLDNCSKRSFHPSSPFSQTAPTPPRARKESKGQTSLIR